MSRLLELKEKSWQKLNADERKEYKELTGSAGTKLEDREFKPGHIVAGDATMVTEKAAPKNQMDALMARLDALEGENKKLKAATSDGEWQVETEDYVGSRTARMRTKDGKVLIDWKHNPHEGVGKIRFNKDTQEKEMVYVITLLDEKSELVNEDFVWGDLTKLPIIEVILLKQNVKKLVKDTGLVTNRAKVDFEKYKTTRGAEVPLLVKADQVTYTIKLPDGREIEIDSSRLNA